MFRQSRGMKAVDREWHEKGHTARTKTFNLSEWSDEEITRWDLDTDSRRPTGRDTRRSFVMNRAIDTLGENGTDLRTLDDR